MPQHEALLRQGRFEAAALQGAIAEINSLLAQYAPPRSGEKRNELPDWPVVLRLVETGHMSRPGTAFYSGWAWAGASCFCSSFCKVFSRSASTDSAACDHNTV